MLKKTFLAVLLFLIAACSAYFDQGKTGKDGPGFSTLALADGSGYISTDQYNEITPYVFNDTNAGKKWLLFSSDRDGSFDIYFSEINSEGKFSHPVKMDGVIDSSSDEVSPVLFRAYYNNYALIGIFLSYIRVSNGVTTVFTCRLDSNLNIAGPLQSVTGTGYSRLSVLGKDIVYPRLLMANGLNSWSREGWNASGMGTWDNSPVTCTLSNLDQAISSVDGFIENFGHDYTTNWYLFSAMRNGKHQIFAGSEEDYGFSQSFYSIIPYASAYNDKDPVMDEEDFKVYFASDRYGKGNYDLYRYNHLDYFTVNLGFVATPVLNDPGIYYLQEPQPVALTWNAVKGATHYKVFRCVGDQYIDPFYLIADTTETTLTDPWVTNGTYYYYHVQALGLYGVSGFSANVGDLFDGFNW